MADQRIKGQEVEVIIVEGGQPLSTIRDVRSFDISAQLEIMTEGYLGETSDRRDEIYRGFSGSMELHFENPDVIDFTRRIIDRARRREPGLVINIKTTLQFPNGTRTRLLLRDVFFGEVPMSFGSRGDYGTVSLSYEGSDYSVL